MIRYLAAPPLALRFETGTSCIGRVLVAESEDGVAAVLLGTDAGALEDDLRLRFAGAPIERGPVALGDVLTTIDQPERGYSGPISVSGTDFQQRVWTALTAIPIGKTRSYSDIARAIGAPAAVRAVASACRANPVAVLIPCHRVVRGDGGLSGYRWGIERKRALLDREQELARAA